MTKLQSNKTFCVQNSDLYTSVSQSFYQCLELLAISQQLLYIANNNDRLNFQRVTHNIIAKYKLIIFHEAQANNLP